MMRSILVALALAGCASTYETADKYRPAVSSTPDLGQTLQACQVTAYRAHRAEQNAWGVFGLAGLAGGGAASLEERKAADVQACMKQHGYDRTPG